MKKVLGILAVSAALVGFSACGGDDSAEELGTAIGVLTLKIELAVADMGATLDTDCAIEKLATLSLKDITLMTDNFDSDAEDITEYGASEEANAVSSEIGEECISAAEEVSEEVTEETTP